MSPTSILIVIVVYFLFLFIVSYLTNRKADNQTFFVGNHKSPWYLVAIGMVGASLSGVTFVSVPGWVLGSKFYYMQMVMGYGLGYVTIVYVLLPIYYRMNLTSIYTYLEQRFGKVSYKTGASLFLVSRIIGASFRLFLVANVLQITIFNSFHVPFFVTVLITLALIWLYTFKGGIKTIVWTDTLQTLLMLSALGFTIFFITKQMNLSFSAMVAGIKSNELSTMFNFSNWRSGSFFMKQFLSGAFITIVMTGLDQDMMQKNLSCRNIKDAQKNMLSYAAAFLPVNLLFLSLGVLLVMFAQQFNLSLPERSDDLFPMVVTSGILPPVVSLLFVLGLIAAAYSSADSALTALTTSFTIDILGIEGKKEDEIKKTRIGVHLLMTSLLFFVILIFNAISNESIISSLFKAAGYTYGPLLGLYALGIFTKYKINDNYVPIVAIASPIICYVINSFSEALLNGYKFGFEILILNGVLTFFGLLLILDKRRKI